MNYNRIYASIVLRAQSVHNQRQLAKKNGCYYEKHHILPKSLGGSNDKSNLALLTAREHFICHWLLVKIYPINSIERLKMLTAIWRFSKPSKTHGQRYINARAYESLRKEFASTRKFIVNQKGTKNSHYGCKWYTSTETGETKLFKNNPGHGWLPGRNLFNGKTCSLNHNMNRIKYIRIKNNIEKKDKETIKAEYERKQKLIKEHLHDEAVSRARAMWDDYHSHNYAKLEEYARLIHRSKMCISRKFKKYIPRYTKHTQKHLRHFSSDVSLVGVYS